LGFTPVTVGLGDVYTAADKGVIDGAVLPTDLLEGRKLAEVFHYGTKVSLGYNTFYLAMNKKKYESLPADIRKAIDDVGGDHIVDLYAKIWLKLDEQGARYAVEKEKFQFIELSSSELARWEKAVKPVWDAKEADLDAKGLPGKKIIQELKANLAKYSK
jgi:TRAP-type C4-dicarboxylate transport system substrate-binding protein